jgi:osmotically inducible protein OsmC
MSTSKASARWDGTLREGRGTMKPANGPDVAFSVKTRFEGEKGSNPEEMVGAALAGCFSMALSAALGRAGVNPTSIETEASVQLEKQGEGFAITTISLQTQAKVPGLDAAKFETIAQETKAQCPVSKALAGTKISLQARLV